MKAVLFAALAVLLLVHHGCLADLPNHCLHSDVEGKWFLFKTPATHTKDTAHQACVDGIKGKIDPSLTTTVSLTGATATDHTNADSSGTWTMVYDEGFEVTVSNKKYFAFSKYTYGGGTQVTNHCDRTLPGTYHDSVPKGAGAWGCFIGIKSSAVAGGRDLEQTDLQDSDYAFPIAQGSKLGSGASKAKQSNKWSAMQLSSLVEVGAGATVDLSKHMADVVKSVNSDPSSTWTAKLYDEKTQAEIYRSWKSGGLSAKSSSSASLSAAPQQQPQQLQDALSPNTLLQTATNASSPTALAAQGQGGGLPESLDWRSKGNVNYVNEKVGNQNTQGGCGSCYVFAAIGALEARIRIKTNNVHKPDLSVVDVMACSPYSQGCQGGFPYLTGKHFEDFGVLEESCVPYKQSMLDYNKDPMSISDFLQGGDMACKRVNGLRFNAQAGCNERRWYATNYHYVGGHYGAVNEQAMLEEIQNGPMAVGFRAAGPLMSYSSGIFGTNMGANAGGYANSKDSNGHMQWEEVDHAVLLVGYGVQEGQKYWILKNSWGEQWGEGGYFKIARGIDAGGVESLVTAVTPIIDR